MSDESDKLKRTIAQIMQVIRDTPLPGYPWRCADGMCGAEDCPRCHPESAKPKPYDDSHEE